jgi:hypothetical protein
MTKTGQQVEDDVYEFLKSSSLSSFINGAIYKYSMRPRDSKAEDAIVKFITGLDEQIQTGVVVVNIFVPNINAFQTGVLVRNITRCTEIEIAANEWAKSLTAAKSDYLFSLSQTIYTEEEPEINQHFVTIRLKFKLLTT